MEKRLAEFVEKLKAAAGENLQAVVLYGSAVSGEFHKDYSDVNLLCVCARLDADVLRGLGPAIAWWTKQGQPPPMLFSEGELGRSADVFAIELLDMKEAHRVLFGADPFAALAVPTQHHRLQVERELRAHVIRLREQYVASGGDERRVEALLTRSISSFTTLFRHTLLLLGEQRPAGKREAIDQLARILEFDPAPFHVVLELREGKRQAKGLDWHALFRGYLAGVMRVADEVDRRLT
jgi:hypothetical protein